MYIAALEDDNTELCITTSTAAVVSPKMKGYHMPTSTGAMAVANKEVSISILMRL